MISNPSQTAGTSLNDILKLTNPTPGTGGVRGVFGSILGGLGNMVFPGLGSVIGGAITGGALGASLPVLGGESTQYLQLQQEIEQESIAYETASTVLKVRHDTESTAVQNMK